MFVRGLQFVAPAASLVSTDNGTEAMNEPDGPKWLLADLRGTRRPLRRLEHGQRIAAALASQTTPGVVLRSP